MTDEETRDVVQRIAQEVTAPFGMPADAVYRRTSTRLDRRVARDFVVAVDQAFGHPGTSRLQELTGRTRLLVEKYLAPNADTYADVRMPRPRHKWTDAHDALLTKMCVEGRSVEQICRELGLPFPRSRHYVWRKSLDLVAAGRLRRGRLGHPRREVDPPGSAGPSVGRESGPVVDRPSSRGFG